MHDPRTGNTTAVCRSCVKKIRFLRHRRQFQESVVFEIAKTVRNHNSFMKRNYDFDPIVSRFQNTILKAAYRPRVEMDAGTTCSVRSAAVHRAPRTIGTHTSSYSYSAAIARAPPAIISRTCDGSITSTNAPNERMYPYNHPSSGIDVRTSRPPSGSAAHSEGG